MGIKKANELQQVKDDSETGGILWKVNTGQLFQEIIADEQNAIFKNQLNILRRILIEVGQRSADLNDDKLNALMCRLAIYEIADPYSGKFNEELTNALIKKGYSNEDAEDNATAEGRP